MYTGHRQSNLGLLLSSKSIPNAQEIGSDEPRPGRPRIVTAGVDRLAGLAEKESEKKVEAIDSSQRDRASTFDPSAMRNAPAIPPATSLSPAAMFLSSFSPTPSNLSLSLPDDEGEEVAGYTLGGIIGYGGFSTVRRAFSASGGSVAVKIVRRSDLMKQGNFTNAQKRLDHETEVWKSLSHEHILPLFTSVHTSYADFFVTLLCPAGSLFDIMKREGRPALPQDDVGTMFRQVVRGLRYLHEDMGLVHRDMKLENVLVDETGTCKICDFGMARKIGEVLDEEEEEEESEEDSAQTDGLHTNVQRAASISFATTSRRQAKARLPIHNSLHRPSGHGPRHRNSTTTSTAVDRPAGGSGMFQPGSLPYAAPELLSPPANPGLRLPHPAQDIWALGIMLFTLLSGQLPFNDSFEPRLQMKILHGAYDIPTGIGQGAERVLRGCLEKEVSNRWTILMIDEVAWGVGWGTEVGNATIPVVSDEELRLEVSSRISTPASRSRSRAHGLDSSIPPPTPRTPYSEHAERSPASAEVASRRSTSRAERSLSRAPVYNRRSSERRSEERGHTSSSSRRVSRRRPLSPSSSSISHSVFSTRSTRSGSSGSSASSSELEEHEGALVSPQSLGVGVGVVEVDMGMELHERGRRLQKGSFQNQNSMSRSPSPSVVPATPVDYRTTSQLVSPPPLEIGEGDDGDVDVDDARTRSRMKAKAKDEEEDSRMKFRGRSRYLNRPGVPPSEPNFTLGAGSTEEEDSESHEVFLVDATVDQNQTGGVIPMPMDQDYLSSASVTFTSPKNLADTVSLPPIHRAPGSIVRSQSDRQDAHALGRLHEREEEFEYETHSYAARRGRLSTPRDRSQHYRYGYGHGVGLGGGGVKTQQRAGSTPPAPLSSWTSADGGRTSALRFSEHRLHSHSHSHNQSQSHTPYGHPYGHSRGCEGLSLGMGGVGVGSHMLAHSVSDSRFREGGKGRSRSTGVERSVRAQTQGQVRARRAVVVDGT